MVDLIDKKDVKTSSKKGTTGGDEKKNTCTVGCASHGRFCFTKQSDNEEHHKTVKKYFMALKYRVDKGFMTHGQFSHLPGLDFINCPLPLVWIEDNILEEENKGKSVDKKKKGKEQDKENADHTYNDELELETFETVVMTKGMIYAKKIADVWFKKNFDRKIIHDKRLIRLFGPYGYGKSTFLRCLQREQTYKKHCTFVKLKVNDLMTGKIADVESNIDKLFDAARDLYIKTDITTVFLLDEKELLLNSRDDKSSKELSMVTGILLEKLGIPWNEAPGYLLAMATNREFDMDGAADSRSEDAYFAVFDDNERAQMLKRSLGRAKINKKPVPTDKNIDHDKLVIYVRQYDGRNFASASNKYANWYVDHIEKRTFQEGHIVTEKQLANFLDSYRLELEQQLIIRRSRVPKRKPYFRRRVDDNDPNKPILSMSNMTSSNADMLSYISKTTKVSLDKVWEQFHAQLNGDGKVQADSCLVQEYEKIKKINDMKEEFNKIVDKEE